MRKASSVTLIIVTIIHLFKEDKIIHIWKEGKERLSGLLIENNKEIGF